MDIEFLFQTSLHVIIILDRKGKFSDLESIMPFTIQNTFKYFLAILLLKY